MLLFLGGEGRSTELWQGATQTERKLRGAVVRTEEDGKQVQAASFF